MGAASLTGKRQGGTGGPGSHWKLECQWFATGRPGGWKWEACGYLTLIRRLGLMIQSWQVFYEGHSKCQTEDKRMQTKNSRPLWRTIVPVTSFYLFQSISLIRSGHILIAQWKYYVDNVVHNYKRTENSLFHHIKIKLWETLYCIIPLSVVEWFGVLKSGWPGFKLLYDLGQVIQFLSTSVFTFIIWDHSHHYIME